MFEALASTVMQKVNNRYANSLCMFIWSQIRA